MELSGLFDVSSPTFDVDLGLSEEERRLRLAAFTSAPLKGWNSYDGWDWVPLYQQPSIAAHLQCRLSPPLRPPSLLCRV